MGLLLDLRRSSCILACNIIPYYSIILFNSCILEVILVLGLLWLSYTQSRPLRNSLQARQLPSSSSHSFPTFFTRTSDPPQTCILASNPLPQSIRTLLSRTKARS